MPDTKVTFHETFVSEHRSTERLLSAFKELASAGRWSDLQHAAETMARTLQTHIDVEEEYVYPAVERHTNDDDLMRTLTVLRKRHREIPAYASEIIHTAREQDPEETLAAIDLLGRVLTDHHGTEESEIFPLFEADGPLASAAPEAARMLSEAHA